MAPRLSPYVCLAGTAREALDHYRSVLGGEVTVSTFAEFGGGGGGADPDGVMHGQLDTPDGFTLMVSDAMPGAAASTGGNVALCLSGDDAAHLRACFAGLAEGGEVTTPLEVQVWGDEYGALIDRFGVDWMVNVSALPA
ncbi:VOC family protein [Kineococcus radiotolerans]|uniref:Glyoxalase/bleomycin resistance protein/dioxygenase n=1 Tax=Kineococcus radiotolerans (strain ATCC BAA-149 / DSM 14245 / SRS30216) TaxID=266940 RepID=A6W4S8_KINRD|nr:VOC family protein [Kineococcus radiotolerans]ABS01817.1 Glyoxalase/bleomycin resistance protein/dioxygenase [Kineococcus radiotolerans SRS30216 = ATCC BAA-149]